LPETDNRGTGAESDWGFSIFRRKTESIWSRYFIEKPDQDLEFNFMTKQVLILFKQAITVS